MQDDVTSLPMLSVPYDVFRHGLSTLKDDIGHQHVVEAIQKNVSSKILRMPDLQQRATGVLCRASLFNTLNYT